MKKLSKTLVTATLAISSLGVMGAASAMPFGGGPGNCMRGGHPMGPGFMNDDRGFMQERMMYQLGLTADQRSQVESILQESEQQLSELRERMRGNGEKIRAASRQIPVDETEIRRLADAQGDLKSDMIVLMARQRARINMLLTDDQRAVMDERFEQRRKYWRH